MPGYGDKEYWETRYAAGGPDGVEEWIQPYPVLRPILSAELRPTDCILILGSGTSTLGEDLHDDGYGPITGIDFVDVAVRVMSARAAGRPRLAYRTMDACALGFPAASFDAVIDKGTLDAILCRSDGEPMGRRMMGEVARVLRPRGVFICVSLHSARARMPLFTGWEVKKHATPKRRLIEGADEEMNSNWVYVLSRDARTGPP